MGKRNGQVEMVVVGGLPKRGSDAVYRRFATSRKRRGKRGGVKGVDGVNKELEREIRKTVEDMLWLADAKVNEEEDNETVRSYRQGQADALRQWAKTIELRLLKKKSPTATLSKTNNPMSL